MAKEEEFFSIYRRSRQCLESSRDQERLLLVDHLGQESLRVAEVLPATER